MQKCFREILKEWKTLLVTLMKWFILSTIIGITVGSIASIFFHAITWATAFRTLHPLIIFGLPIGGILIVFLYKIAGQEKDSGTNMILEAVRANEVVIPGQVTPLILISTFITHLFGGSSGREGAALQFGASFADVVARRLKLNESDQKIIILSGMSAAFSALFGTPMAATIFPMEFISVGTMYYAALVPCAFSSFISYYISLILNVRTEAIPYLIEKVPNFYSLNAVKCIVIAFACAIVGALFCILLHKSEYLFHKFIKNQYIRIVTGASAVIILYLIIGTDDYLGLGLDAIHRSFYESVGIEMFLLKIVFTCMTICVGFKGGEIVPSIFIGATLGSAISTLLGMPINLCAASGMVGVFCAVTNSPITSILIAFEMFGFEGMPYYCIVIAISYLLSGYHSLYKEQKIVYSKTMNKYINRKTL